MRRISNIYSFISSQAKPINGMRFFLQDPPEPPKKGFVHKASWDGKDTFNIIQRIHLYENKRTYCIELTPENNRLFHSPPPPLSNLRVRIYGIMSSRPRLFYEKDSFDTRLQIFEKNNVAFINEASSFYQQLQKLVSSKSSTR